MSKEAARAPERAVVRRWDLGVRSLWPEWKALLHPRHLREDVVAGLTVACIALPLSLAIALASDVPPALGLVTAIVAGIVAALFGGSRLAVAGPAAAMAVLVGQVVDAHGLTGLLVVGLGCGLLQIASGVFGLGRFVRLVPVSVVHGFTAGIGLLILIGQLPRALGLPAPDESHVVDVAIHLGTYLGHAIPAAVVIGAGAMLATMFLPKLHPRIPGALLAVAVPTIAVAVFELEVPLLGPIPDALPLPSVPSMPDVSELGGLLGAMLVVFALASLESLLSASAVDKLSGGPQHDADQELIGQGLANTASSLFGGIPVTSVIARSALNVQSGAKTRRSAILHALVLIACVLALAPYVARIPIPALGGVLLAVGARMLGPRYLIETWRSSRADAAIYVVTAGVIVAFDLLIGVQAGCVAALAAVAWRLSRARIEVHAAHAGLPHHVDLWGPFNFLSAPRLDRVRDELAGLDASHGLVIDVRHVDNLDATAGEAIVALFNAWSARDGAVAILGPNAEVRQRLVDLGGERIERWIAAQERDLDRMLERPDVEVAQRAHRRLITGVERFHDEVRERLSPLFSQLATGQRPHTLFITCADSRISPHLMTHSHPGELMIVRNLGALVPPDDGATGPSEGGTVEYAIRVLGVRNVVVCAHANCGALTALHSGKLPKGLPTLERWASNAHALTGPLGAYREVNDAARAVAVRQLDHLRSYEVVREKLAAGELRLAAWFFEVDRGEIVEWRASENRYVRLGSEELLADAAQ